MKARPRDLTRRNVTFLADPKYLPEPLLDFGGGHRHQDPRFGLMEVGPVDADSLAPRQIKLGIIGSGQTTNGLLGWLTHCEGGLPKKNSRQPNLFPEFPGSGTSGPFKCHFSVEDTNVVAIPYSAISRVAGESNDDTAMRAALDLFAGGIESLSQRDNPPT